jgi:hypothetical protein
VVLADARTIDDHLTVWPMDNNSVDLRVLDQAEVDGAW